MPGGSYILVKQLECESGDWSGNSDIYPGSSGLSALSHVILRTSFGLRTRLIPILHARKQVFKAVWFPKGLPKQVCIRFAWLR